MQRTLNLILALFITTLLMGVNAHAQKSIRIGFDAGINFANLTNSIFGDDYKATRNGLVIGGLAEIGIADGWYIQLEPKYIQKGAQVGGYIFGTLGPESSGLIVSVLKMDYLELPVLIKARLATGSFKPFLFAGPNIGCLISAKRVFEGDVDIQGMSSFDVRSNFESFEISLDFGAGGEFQVLPAISLLADIRYSYGLNNVNTETLASYPGIGAFGILPIHNYGFQFLTGMLFTL
ncbi:MAG: porin family protein [Bacteroidota bacterium]